MGRIARVVAAGIPHHITQRGNRRQLTFFCEDDYREYISLMAEWCFQCAIEVWAYCLMANHVHLGVVPESEDALRKGIGEAHRRYTRRVNFREGWRGHLWQRRFSSFPLDENKLLERITVNPKIFGGKPIIRGRRLAVEHVLGMLAAGDTPERILKGYPWLEMEDIQACLVYARRMVSHERVEPLLVGTGA